MNKLEKKKARLQENIRFLEDQLTSALTRKDADTKEMDVGKQQRKIADLRLELKNLK